MNSAFVGYEELSNFARAAHFFVHFFDCPCFALLQLETSRNFLVTRFMGRMSSVFFHCRSFSPWWPLAFLIFSLPLQIFMFLQQKMPLCLFSFALALFLVEFRWPVALVILFLCLSLSLYSKFVDMIIN